MFAAEFVTSLCESAPELLRKHLPQIESLLRTAAAFVCHVDDDPEWASKEEEMSNTQSFADVIDDAAAMSAVADDIFDRLATAIGGRAMVHLPPLSLLVTRTHSLLLPLPS